MNVDVFFEGGGILGIGLIGAYKALSERGIKINKAMGISSGALVASLIISGYSANELIDILNYHTFQMFKQKTKIAEKNYIGKPLSILYNKGIYDSKIIEKFIEELLMKKDISTFQDVMYQNDSQLKIIATDFTNKRMLLLPDDLAQYGVDPYQFSIAKAVRMSCAIPLFYTPVEFQTKSRTNYIIDGCVIKNVSTKIINKDGILRNLTLRFRIKDLTKNKWIDSLIDKRNSEFLSSDPLEKLIVIENNSNIKATDFDVTKDQIIHLYKQGYKATLKFIKNELYE